MKNELMVNLNPEFKRELFLNLLARYGIKSVVKELGKTHGTIYHYKNNRVKFIPLNLIKKVVNLVGLDEQEIEKNIREIKKFSEVQEKGLSMGRKIRRIKVREKYKLNVRLPDILILQDNKLFLDIEKWLIITDWVNKLKTQSGFVKDVQDVKICENSLFLSYCAYNRGRNKIEKYDVCFPRKLDITDSKFLYLLGFMYGDGTSGSRIGVVNKEFELIEYSSNILRKVFVNSKIEGNLFLYKKLNKKTNKKLEENVKSISDKYSVYKIVHPNVKGDYVYAVFITNNILRKIINCLYSDLIHLISLLGSKHIGAFLAGFFDAEGNVNKLDKTFRFSQKTKKKVMVIKELLDYLGFPETKIVDYEDMCQKYDTDEINDEHEEKIGKEYGDSVILEKFPQRTHPFWNMKHYEDGIFNKVDVLLHGMETIGSAERSIDVEEMKNNFLSISDGEYSKLLFDKFSKERVMGELEDYLSMEMFPRFGGGIGMTRMARAMRLSNLLE